MANVIESILITRRAFGTTDTHCLACGKKETFKIIDGKGSHTYKCDCGCTVYRFHEPDEFHPTAFFLKSFIPKHFFKKNYKQLSSIEKAGFKQVSNGKKVFSR